MFPATVALLALAAVTVLGQSVTRIDQEPVGSLQCNGEAEYTVTEEEISRLIFANPVAVNYKADIESLTMGSLSNSNTTNCRARHLDGKLVIATKFQDCGFTLKSDGSNHSMAYSNRATVAVRLPAPFSHLLRRKTFVVPVECVVSGTAEVIINTQWFPQFYITVPLVQTVRVPINAKIRKEHRDEAYGERDVYVNILTVELEGVYAQQFNILGRRIYTTPQADPKSLPLTDFVTNGCPSYPNFSTITTVGTEKIVYEILDFALNVSNSYFFHVEVSICPKSIAGQQGHCEPDICLPAGGLTRGKRNTGFNMNNTSSFGGASAPQQMSPYGEPRLTIGADGIPILKSRPQG
ncbi:hypothetical protein BV898_13907 [Hypsibius exemplaris]|uniref:ZP domain-containing protein n=1 Tax=Hypsibius exemplaris TaxID=2072580 RepID=A0A1W0W9F6_HYPEX|nr:hypothetical protein BV898_13907 [Hypsibius exemplaris]